MLRTTTLLLCLLSLALTGCSSPPEHPKLAEDERATVAEFERVVGSLSVGTDDEQDLMIDESGHVIVVDLSGKEELTDELLAQIGKLVHLQKLYLTSTPITDAGLAHLAGLSELTNLELSSTAVTNAGLAHLKPLKNLRTVICRNTQINSTGSNELKKTLPSVLITHDGKPSVP
jgi:hypothetical protein